MSLDLPHTALHCVLIPESLIGNVPNSSFSQESCSSMRDICVPSHYALEPQRSLRSLQTWLCLRFLPGGYVPGRGAAPTDPPFLICKIPAPGLLRRSQPCAPLAPPTCGRTSGVCLWPMLCNSKPPGGDKVSSKKSHPNVFGVILSF